MSHLDRLADRLAIEELNASFAYHLDHDEVDSLAELFTEDAIYTNGARRSEGRADIAAFFRSRTAAGPRTARHMYSGLRIQFEDNMTATAYSVWLSFAQNAVPPVSYSMPFLIADFIDTYELCADDKWRIKRRHIEPIFRDPAGTPPGAAATK